MRSDRERISQGISWSHRSENSFRIYAAKAVPLSDVIRRDNQTKSYGLMHKKRRTAPSSRKLPVHRSSQLPHNTKSSTLRHGASNTGLGALLMQERGGKLSP
ncbi:Hypothetical predicted protein, partial [Paramuricea clavata]